MKWVEDLEQYINRIPYGQITINVDRVDRKTTKITTFGKETLQYRTTEEALKDLTLLLKKLADNNYEGTATLELQYKAGRIKLVGIYDQKITRY